MALSTKKKRAISALLTTRTMGEAATETGVAKKTLERWLKEPEFNLVLKGKEDGILAEATRRLIQLQLDAIDTIANIMRDGSQADAQRRLAAKDLLDHTFKSVELRTIAERLDRLEEMRR